MPSWRGLAATAGVIAAMIGIPQAIATYMAADLNREAAELNLEATKLNTASDERVARMQLKAARLRAWPGPPGPAPHRRRGKRSRDPRGGASRSQTPEASSLPHPLRRFELPQLVLWRFMRSPRPG
jgi:hypothetical protein